MNIRQLQFFYQAARTGNFSTAAREAGVTVQAVSKSIHELEEELGGKLFAREGRGMRLTPLGATLLEPARRAVESFASVEQAASSWGKDTPPRDDLRIALVTPPFSKHEFICGIVARLMTHSLGVETHLSVRVGAKALADLRSGNLDALFTIGRLDAPGCVCTPVGTILPGVFLGRHHPLRGRRQLSFADLAPYPVLWNDEVDGFNETVLVTCRQHGLASPVESISTNEEVVDFLENRNGYIMGVNLKALSILPFVMMHDLDPTEAPAIPVCLVMPEDERRPEAERLDQFCRSEFSIMKLVFSSDKSVTGY